jgi:membrane protease YdiL (CAAX protease family)
MKAILLFSFLLVCSLIVFAVPTIVAPFADYGGYSMYDAGQAVLLCLSIAIVIGYFIYRNKEEGSFLLQLFGWALLVRMLAGVLRRRCYDVRLLRLRPDESVAGRLLL